MKRFCSTSILCIAAATLALPVDTGVQAQNALGTGNVLDRNLGVGTGGINPATPTPNFRDRNLLVTGDVIGGRGFRGSVGYTAESDFRGALGSNDLFNFRAGSAISSAPLFQIGSTYERVRFGQDLGLVEYRRAGSAAPASLNAQDPIAISNAVDRFRMDRRIVTTAAALSPQHGMEPRVVGTAFSPEGTLYMFNSSTLRGLTVEPAADNPALVGFSSYDVARVREDIADGRPPSLLGSPFQTPFNVVREPKPADVSQTIPIEPKQDTQVGARRVDDNIPQDYQQVLKRVAERYAKAEHVDPAASPEFVDQLDKEYQRLREQLTGQRSPTSDQPGGRQPLGQESSSDASANTTAATPPRRDPLMPTPPLGRDPTTGLPVEPTTTPVPSSIEFAAALRHGQSITTLTGPSKDRFNELMAAAEQKLREGDYFAAERRFDRALRFSPGHPLAVAGMAHSQIGAGMYLSASLTLRNLFTHQPEMIDTVFGEGLMPSKDRLAAAVGGVTRRLEMSESNDRASYGLLLAYIGHQTKDASLIEQGLNAMAQAEPGHPLLEVLRGIWQAAPTEQAEEPAPQK